MYKTIGSKIVKIDEGRNGLINETSVESRSIVNEFSLMPMLARLSGVAFKMNTIKREIEESTGKAQLIRSFRDLSEGASDILSNQIYIEGFLDLHKKTLKNLSKYISENKDIVNLYSVYLKREGLAILTNTHRRIFPNTWLPSNYRLNSALGNLTAETVSKLLKLQDKTQVATSYSSSDILSVTSSIGYDNMKDFLLALSSESNWNKYTVELTRNTDLIHICADSYDNVACSSPSNDKRVTVLEVINNCVGILSYLETHYLADSLNTEIEEEIISESHLGTNDDIRKILEFLCDLLFEISTFAILQNVAMINDVIEESALKNAMYERIELIKTKTKEMK